MPSWLDRHTGILQKLKDAIKHSDSEIAARRRLAIEKWIKTYIEEIEYLEHDKLQFLCRIFRDENCWSGTRLNTATLGKMLTEEKIDEVKNPLCIFNMACRYCVVDRICPLFQKQLESYKNSFSSDEVDDDGKPAIGNLKYIRSELLDAMNVSGSVVTFWINKKSGELKKHENAEEGFIKAVELKWSEGVEYFYRRVNNQEGNNEIDNLIIKAFANLSTIQANHNIANVYDVLLHEIITDPTKHKLLLLPDDKGNEIIMYKSFATIMSFGFVDTIENVVNHLFLDNASVPQEMKILSNFEYARSLSQLSDLMLENSNIDVRIMSRKIFIDLWRCNRFIEHRRAVFETYKDIRTFIRMERALANLIVDWKRNDNNDGIQDIAKKGTILEILKFVKDNYSEDNFTEFKKQLVKNLRTVGRTGMRDDIAYDDIAEKLFLELAEAFPNGDPQNLKCSC